MHYTEMTVDHKFMIDSH